MTEILLWVAVGVSSAAAVGFVGAAVTSCRCAKRGFTGCWVCQSRRTRKNG